MSTVAKDDELLTVDYVAQRVNVSDKTIRRWIREKHLACSLVGPSKRIRIKRSEMNRLLQGQKADA